MKIATNWKGDPTNSIFVICHKSNDEFSLQVYLNAFKCINNVFKRMQFR